MSNFRANLGDFEGRGVYSWCLEGKRSLKDEGETKSKRLQAQKEAKIEDEKEELAKFKDLKEWKADGKSSRRRFMDDLA